MVTTKMYLKSSVHNTRVPSLQCWLNTAELSLGHLQVHVRSVTESHMKRYGYVLFSRSSGPGLSLH